MGFEWRLLAGMTIGLLLAGPVHPGTAQDRSNRIANANWPERGTDRAGDRAPEWPIEQVDYEVPNPPPAVLEGAQAPIAAAQEEPPRAPHEEAEADPLPDLRDHRPAPHNLWLSAEYLTYRPRRALDFAISDTGAAQAVQGPIESLEFDRDSGLRLRLGSEISEDEVVFTLSYLYLHNTNQRTVTRGAAPGARLLAVLFHPGGAFQDADTATGEASIDFDVLDLELTRYIVSGPTVSIRIDGGARLAWIDQELRARYTGGDFVAAGLARNVIDFDGGGIRFGGQAEWSLGRGLALFGRAHASLLVGDVGLRVLQTSGAVLVTDVEEEETRIIPVTDLAAGLGWQREMGRATTFVRIGYEISTWFGLAEALTFVDSGVDREGIFSRSPQNLGLDGLFLELGLLY